MIIMPMILRIIGVLTIIGGAINGYTSAKSYSGVEKILGRSIEIPFQWSVALTWWIIGIISGVLFFTFALILEKLIYIEEDMNDLKYSLASSTDSDNKPNYAAKRPSSSNSKMNLDAAKGYKMKSLD
ncbi:hypothetical protein ACFSTH_08085 [Paenibacillus yanchengensis]|uniref:Uncharacterized protein n=1 Tax=Paenibacillus yanchengensis TaxID=2035833 RepID=A0ABW4YL57_9BACL